jgi:hypothetical protein
LSISVTDEHDAAATTAAAAAGGRQDSAMIRAIKRAVSTGVLAVAAASAGCAYDGYGYYYDECGYELYDEPCHVEPAGECYDYYEYVEYYDDCP